MANRGWTPDTKEIDVYIQHVKSIHPGFCDVWCIWLRIAGNLWEARGQSKVSEYDARSKVKKAYKRQINFVDGFNA